MYIHTYTRREIHNQESGSGIRAQGSGYNLPGQFESQDEGSAHQTSSDPVGRPAASVSGAQWGGINDNEAEQAVNGP